MISRSFEVWIVFICQIFLNTIMKLNGHETMNFQTPCPGVRHGHSMPLLFNFNGNVINKIKWTFLNFQVSSLWEGIISSSSFLSGEVELERPTPNRGETALFCWWWWSSSIHHHKICFDIPCCYRIQPFANSLLHVQLEGSYLK